MNITLRVWSNSWHADQYVDQVPIQPSALALPLDYIAIHYEAGSTKPRHTTKSTACRRPMPHILRLRRAGRDLFARASGPTEMRGASFARAVGRTCHDQKWRVRHLWPPHRQTPTTSCGRMGAV